MNDIAYMKLLEANARSNGIDIPFTANAPSTSRKSWSPDYDTVDAGGDVDIYGLDSYVSAAKEDRWHFATNSREAKLLVLCSNRLQHAGGALHGAGLLFPLSGSLAQTAFISARVSRWCCEFLGRTRRSIPLQIE